MNRFALVKRLALDAGISHAAAADRVDLLVTKILRRLRRGQKAALPGVGTFSPGKQVRFRPQQPAKRKGR
jgi:nucleoid DNA-binding protein